MSDDQDFWQVLRPASAVHGCAHTDDAPLCGPVRPRGVAGASPLLLFVHPSRAGLVLPRSPVRRHAPPATTMRELRSRSDVLAAEGSALTHRDGLARRNPRLRGVRPGAGRRLSVRLGHRHCRVRIACGKYTCWSSRNAAPRWRASAGRPDTGPPPLHRPSPAPPGRSGVRPSLRCPVCHHGQRVPHWSSSGSSIPREFWLGR